MPSTIPYDPSLVLANIIEPKALENVKDIAKAQGTADSVHEDLNALLTTRRSLDMTKVELVNLGIDVSDLTDAIEGLNKNIVDTAKAYAIAKVKAEQTIAPLRAKVYKVSDAQESPVDFTQTEIKMMPLSNDSVNMDVQYFSLDTMAQDSQAFSKQISSFVSASTSWMGVSVSTDLSNAVQQQVASQTDAHEISGTLVISVNCTHKNAAMLAPCILNVDKGIKVWNHYFPQDKIVAKDLDSMREIANPTEEEEDPNTFSIISGVTYGSSFVGMVHILNNSKTFSSQKMGSVASSLQAQMDAGGWFAKASGGFGVNASFAENVKSLLSSQNVMSHVSLICMGVIPSIVANEVRIAAQKFAESDPKATMEALAGFQNSTSAVQQSLRQSADAARTGQQMITMKSSEVKATLSALAEVDDGSNKILDVNSLMTALEDYFLKVSEAQAGVPINYYLKDITKDMLASMWMAKYFPGEESGVAITYDDSTPTNPTNGGGGNNGGGGDDGNGGGDDGGNGGGEEGFVKPRRRPQGKGPGPVQRSSGPDVVEGPGPVQSSPEQVKGPGPVESPGPDVVEGPGPVESSRPDIVEGPGPVESSGPDVVEGPGPVEDTPA